MDDHGIVFDRFNIGDIPVLTCRNTQAGQAPVILFLHGFSAARESCQDDMAEYAHNGFYTVAIDNRGHGARPAPHFRDYAFENGKLNILRVRELINLTAYDIPAVIDYLAADPAADQNRICLYGISMGGFITYRALTLEQRIKAAAIFISSPAWDDFPAHVEQICTPGLIEQVKEYAKANSPVNFPGCFYGRPILIQVGKADNHFNLEKLAAFVSTIKKRAPSAMEYIEYENVAHTVTPEMKQKAFAWITRVL